MILERDLNHLSGVIGLLQLASTLSKVDFHRRWEDGPALAFPEYPSLRGCVQILLLSAKVKFAEGNESEALKLIGTAAKIGQLIGQEPTLIGCLIQCSIQMTVLNALDSAVKTHANKPNFLTQSQEILRTLSTPIDVRKALGSELVLGRLGINAIAHVGAEKILGTGQGFWSTAVKFGPVRTEMEYRYVQTIHRLFLDLGKHPKVFRSMHQDTQQLDQKLNRSHDWTLAFTKIYSPTFTGLVRAVSEYEARSRVMSAGVKLLQYHQRDGHFPNSLPKGDAWQDPFLDRSLIYKLSKDGFIVYSVGPDLVDNSGKDRRMDRSQKGQYDIAFRYP